MPKWWYFTQTGHTVSVIYCWTLFVHRTYNNNKTSPFFNTKVSHTSLFLKSFSRVFDERQKSTWHKTGRLFFEMKSSANAFSRNGRATKRNTYFLYSLYWSTWGGGGLVLVGLQTLKTTVNIINNLQFLGLLWIIFKPVPHKLRLQSIYKDVLSSSLRSSFNNKIFIWHLLFGKMESTSKNRNPTQDWTSLIMRTPPPSKQGWAGIFFQP